MWEEEASGQEELTLPQHLSPFLQMEKGGGGSWQQWCQLKDGMQNQQMGWQIAAPNLQQLLCLLFLSSFSGLSKASFFFFSAPSPLSNIFSVNRGNRPQEQQSHRRLAAVVFPYSHASACLDSSGIRNKEADQEGLAGPPQLPAGGLCAMQSTAPGWCTERLFIVPQPNLS